MDDKMQNLRESVIMGDSELVVKYAKDCLKSGVKPLDILEKGISAGAREVGNLFTKSELYLADLVLSGEAMVAGLEAVLPHIEGSDIPFKGKVVLGTVKGDIHNIGKDILKSLLLANGFEVSDLGVDVPPSRFIQEAEHFKADIIAVSALMTTTLGGQKDVIEYLEGTGNRQKFIVMVGGGATTREWADKIGADGFAETAPAAIALATKLIEERRS
ncbi:MAG: B12-binding domain-containing protein [Candidatus Thorarchaeota archaeon]